MGKIISSKRSENGVIFELEVEYEEATILQGHYDNVHVFTENVAEFKTNISSRGKNSVTKYFLIPRNLRKKVDWKCMVHCQKIELDEKFVFIYVVDKFRNGVGNFVNH